MTANPCTSLRWCLALLDGLLAAGLTRLVLSPGARSTPMVLAAQRCEAAGQLPLTPILDERSAAFFALGLARASGRPVALLATSGSAPAHWYPAVIEAAETGLPLLLLSADRPPRLRGFGANQTIDQTRLFGAFVREAHDPGLPSADPATLKAIRALGLRAGTQAQGPHPGPVQVNLPFDEPLVPDADCIAAADLVAPPPGPGRPPPVPGLRLDGLQPGDWPAGRGLLVCGPGADRAGLAALPWPSLAALALPVLADPLSGLRTTPAADAMVCSSHYDSLLRHPAAAALRPDWVLRVGAAPVSKTLGRWLAGIPSILCDPAGGWSDPEHDLIARLTAPPAALLAALAAAGVGTPDADWYARWGAAEARVAALAAAELATAPWCEGQVIRTLFPHLAPDEALLCSNSLPIRQLDTWSGPLPPGVRVLGNRGVSGIDGQLSTLAGSNAAGVPTWGLLGDLSLCHDLSGLLLAEHWQRPLLVINNGGGRIFDYLPQRGLPDYERLWRTPVAPPLAALAAAFGVVHQAVGDAAALSAALAAPPPRPLLIEVQIDAERSRAMHQDYWRRVAADPLLDRLLRAAGR
ncbi:MAG: 2-succinyl-5-enolpyruvyl-6-hydroxy-3-cyclohexene-1-carboxylic-acid synthase [Chromatiaceae bacterium]|nr:MAG: 2-succinyl-5-enolpyruvyl-6-hydroxy-3-cyclohexene-1-carboxylic-acid synthase [Chromatiaceae bacterium]